MAPMVKDAPACAAADGVQDQSSEPQLGCIDAWQGDATAVPYAVSCQWPMPMPMPMVQSLPSWSSPVWPQMPQLPPGTYFVSPQGSYCLVAPINVNVSAAGLLEALAPKSDAELPAANSTGDSEEQRSTSAEEHESPRMPMEEPMHVMPQGDLAPCGRFKDEMQDELELSPQSESGEAGDETTDELDLEELESAFHDEIAMMNGREMGQEILAMLWERPSRNSRKRSKRTQYEESVMSVETTSRSSRSAKQRLCCNFILRMGSDYVPTIIGKGGINTRSIHEETGCKVRVRGRGSGHKEQHSNQEAPTNLMLAVTSEASNKEGFISAVYLGIRLLWAVDKRFQYDCKMWGIHSSSPAFYISMEDKDLKAELAEVLGRDFTELPDTDEIGERRG
ncbi:Dnah7 [Symbiodinium pilosum]|uniref:Dnah7 protein n=1 Tax=Symbiodinium pilosum TaxID=2952 RepID=A0A812X7V2_SYMPI|nr:Dnah7 [Symbiodinium pilosum]